MKKGLMLILGILIGVAAMFGAFCITVISAGKRAAKEAKEDFFV